MRSSLLLRTANWRVDLAAVETYISEHPVIELHELLFGLAVCPLEEPLGQHLPSARNHVSHDAKRCSVLNNETSAYTALQLGLSSHGLLL